MSAIMDNKMDGSTSRPRADEDAAAAAEARRKAGARRTAWIITAIVIAFFVASLVQGHFVGIPNWVPTR